jgi:hypothetical protein
MLKLNEKMKNLIAIILIIGMGLLYNADRMNKFPVGIHSWAQADRYAIALGFIDNGFDFFHPQTYVLNKQFPGNFKVPSDSGITAVDFPVHDFASGLLMQLFDTRAPWCFRLYTFIYSAIGLFFLFRLSGLCGLNFSVSLFVIALAGSSPVFLWYQAGFLPSIPSLANAIIGIYFYFKYLKSKNRYDFILSVLFVTLASLNRTSFFLAFASILAYEFLYFIRSFKVHWYKLISIGLGLTILISYYIYNGILRSKYGSVFLGQIMPPENAGHAYDLLVLTFRNLVLIYFTHLHYFLFTLIICISVYQACKRKFLVSLKPTVGYVSMFWLIAIYLIACLCFLVALLQQFPDHDYYFLDSFFLPVLLVFIYLLSGLQKWMSKFSGGIPFIMVPFIVLLIVFGNITKMSRKKTGYWDRTLLMVKNYSTSASLFESAGIAKDAKILTLEVSAPNLPFVLMDRKGYCSMDISANFYELSKSWDYDYLVVQTEFILSDIYKNYPVFINEFCKIAENGFLTIFTRQKPPAKQSLEEFLEINKSTPVLLDSVDFEKDSMITWKNAQKSTDMVYDGNFSGYMSNAMEFGITYQKNSDEVLKKGGSVLKLSGWYTCPDKEISDCLLILSVNSDGQNTYYQSIKLNEKIDESMKWKYIESYFILPEFNGDDMDLSLYLWNTGKINLYYDNLKLEYFQTI